MNFIRKHWFILFLLAALTLGLLFPSAGIALSMGNITPTVLIIAIFFITGLTLPVEKLKSGLKEYRVHIFLQLFIFIVIPLYFFLTLHLFDKYFTDNLTIGIYALACLPTTVSSCIMFTQISRGNVVTAIFNATLANILGVVVSPILLSLFLNTAGDAMALEDILRVFTGLGYKIIVPLITGIIFHRFMPDILSGIKGTLSLVSNIALLIIIFMSFAKHTGEFSQTDLGQTVIAMCIYLALSYLVFVVLSFGISRTLGLDRELTITALYVAPQKTMALGLTLITTFFAGKNISIGLILLPLLFYYPWQMIVSGVIRSILISRTPARS